jgi:chemotaxis signal transduction protein
VLHSFILPVVDLAAVLRLERGTPPSRLLVAEADELRVGFAVDDVAGVVELPDQIEEPESPVLLGAVLADGALIGIIDVARAIGSAAVPAAEPDVMRAVRS